MNYRKKAMLMAGALLCLNLSIYSQSISLKMNNVSVKKAMTELQAKSGYSFVYIAGDVDTNRTVSVNANELKDAVAQILKGQNVSYEIQGKNIVVKKGGQPQVVPGKKRKVTGNVCDINGEPIIGATVLEKGTTNGTVTDFEGNYSLEMPDNSVLVVSYIGYKSQEFNISQIKQDRLAIIMQEDTELMDGVVVIGYGSMKKSDLTGAVVSANIKDFEKAPNANLLQSLQGSVPGLNVGQVTSAGTTPTFSIRGTNTLAGNSNVLIVLDGIIYNSSLSSINPNDIASIDILKDASATAVYGAQAANGVILITTKRGKVGKPKLSFSSSYTISNPTKDLHPMNREEYLDFTKEFWYDYAYTGDNYQTPNPDFRLADYLPDAVMLDNTQPDGISPYDYDWWDEGTRTGSMWENKVSLSGGTEGISYLISYANTRQKGVILNDDFSRNSVRVNLDTNPYKWLKVGVQAFASFVNQDGAEPNYWMLNIQNPLIEPYDENGDLVPYPFQTLDTNPFMASDVDDKERHNYFFANFYGEVKLPVKGLTYRINYGNNYRIDEHFQANPYGASLTGEAYKQHTSYYDYTVDNILNYEGEFGDHSIGATLLYGASERKYNYTEAKAQNFSRLTLGYNSLELGKDQYTSSDAWHEALLYQMARVNYKYKNRYLLTATVRRDGFSGFAENNKTAVFPSVALGWVISEEEFFKVPWIDYLKLRGGWGISGNQTTRYKSLAQVSSNPGYVFGDGGSTEIYQQITSMSNQDLMWEKTMGYNFGVDFNLFNNRLVGSLEAYQTTTNDLLYDMTIPTMTGFSSVSTNIGKIRNKGVELTLTSRNIVTRDFEWSTTFNISRNSNKILSLFGKDADGDGVEDDLIASNLFIGESTTAIYGYVIDGIYQLGDDIPNGYHPGNYKIRDTNGDGEITVDDRVVIGSEDPACRLSFMNKFRYKNFSLSLFFNSVLGGKDGYLGENSSALNRGDANARRWNMPAEFAADHWSPSNPNATYSRSTAAGAIVPTAYQSRSFLRLQDINLSYDFPKSWLRNIGIEGLGLYVSGKNLFTITNWKGWDPEANSNYYGRPVLRSFTFGLNLTL